MGTPPLPIPRNVTSRVHTSVPVAHPSHRCLGCRFPRLLIVHPDSIALESISDRLISEYVPHIAVVDRDDGGATIQSQSPTPSLLQSICASGVDNISDYLFISVNSTNNEDEVRNGRALSPWSSLNFPCHHGIIDVHKTCIPPQSLAQLYAMSSSHRQRSLMAPPPSSSLPSATHLTVVLEDEEELDNAPLHTSTDSESSQSNHSINTNTGGGVKLLEYYASIGFLPRPGAMTRLFAPIDKRSSTVSHFDQVPFTVRRALPTDASELHCLLHHQPSLHRHLFSVDELEALLQADGNNASTVEGLSICGWVAEVKQQAYSTSSASSIGDGTTAIVAAMVVAISRSSAQMLVTTVHPALDEGSEMMCALSNYVFQCLVADPMAVTELKLGNLNTSFVGSADDDTTLFHVSMEYNGIGTKQMPQNGTLKTMSTSANGFSSPYATATGTSVQRSSLELNTGVLAQNIQWNGIATLDDLIIAVATSAPTTAPTRTTTASVSKQATATAAAITTTPTLATKPNPSRRQSSRITNHSVNGGRRSTLPLPLPGARTASHRRKLSSIVEEARRLTITAVDASNNNTQVAEETLALVISTLRDYLISSELTSSAATFTSSTPLGDAGLDSLDMLKLAVILSEVLGVALPSTMLFDYPTADALCAYILAVQGIANSTRRRHSSVLMSATQSPGGLVPLSGALDEDKQQQQQQRRRRGSMFSQGELRITSLGQLSGATTLVPHIPSIQVITLQGTSSRLPSPSPWHAPEHRHTDAPSPVPPHTRWDVDMCMQTHVATPRFSSFLQDNDLTQFDHTLFGINSLAETSLIDPQQRLLLECSYESGIFESKKHQNIVSVHVGASYTEYLILSSSMPHGMSSHTASGGSLSVLAGRISFVFGLSGPSVVVDTACSSGIVALAGGFSGLRLGLATAALSAAVNLMLLPQTTAMYHRAGMLTPDGRCKTFDQGADGYVRAEAVGAAHLKAINSTSTAADEPLSSSTPNTIFLVSAVVNQDGKSSSLTAPNGPAQQALIKDALKVGHVSASEVRLLHTHGTGTSLGDPIEVNSSLTALENKRNKGDPLALAASKTHYGHGEPAAGAVALLRCMNALEENVIDPLMHLHHVNQYVSECLNIHGQNMKTMMSRGWAPGVSARTESRIGGVSSFAFQGTNAHAVVKCAPNNDGMELQQNRSSRWQTAAVWHRRRAWVSAMCSHHRLLNKVRTLGGSLVRFDSSTMYDDMIGIGAVVECMTICTMLSEQQPYASDANTRSPCLHGCFLTVPFVRAKHHEQAPSLKKNTMSLHLDTLTGSMQVYCQIYGHPNTSVGGSGFCGVGGGRGAWELQGQASWGHQHHPRRTHLRLVDRYYKASTIVSSAVGSCDPKAIGLSQDIDGGVHLTTSLGGHDGDGASVHGANTITFDTMAILNGSDSTKESSSSRLCCCHRRREKKGTSSSVHSARMKIDGLDIVPPPSPLSFTPTRTKSSANSTANIQYQPMWSAAHPASYRPTCMQSPIALLGPRDYSHAFLHTGNKTQSTGAVATALQLFQQQPPPHLLTTSAPHPAHSTTHSVTMPDHPFLPILSESIAATYRTVLSETSVPGGVVFGAGLHRLGHGHGREEALGGSSVMGRTMHHPKLVLGAMSRRPALASQHTGASWLISGGTGALGQLTSEWIRQQTSRAQYITLLNTSGMIASGSSKATWRFTQPTSDPATITIQAYVFRFYFIFVVA